ncbi:hypothetical protein OIU85_011273 [Salix viminalis]|uniref:Uncharacterized protein n=1 Tax=Salix viminalis TaxID=40686 RepID=A0A9Q0NSF1_SALVM|nr:hypothetical protein OIU85_011273 [Salix viminalis]
MYIIFIRYRQGVCLVGFTSIEFLLASSVHMEADAAFFLVNISRVHLIARPRRSDRTVRKNPESMNKSWKGCRNESKREPWPLSNARAQSIYCVMFISLLFALVLKRKYKFANSLY